MLTLWAGPFLVMVILGTKMVEVYLLMLHTKYQGSRARDLRQEVVSFLLGLAISDKKKFYQY